MLNITHKSQRRDGGLSDDALSKMSPVQGQSVIATTVLIQDPHLT